ncbi:MAG: hypothetical protein WCE61_07795 [Candidatus Acidiferrum sp.]
MLQNLRAMFQNTIEEAMHSRLWHEEEKVREINERLKELTKAYNEFLDLQKETEVRTERMRTLVALIGNIDYNAPIGRETEHKVAMDILREGKDDLRAQLPLWKAMREYLRYVPEARLSAMEEFFQQVQFHEGNRQAMESALKRHPKTFQTRRVKGQRLISLKQK